MNNFLIKNNVILSDDSLSLLNSYVKKNRFSSVFVLVDSNTEKHCLNYLFQKVNFSFLTIKIEPGEINKNIYTCLKIWEKLSEYEADRKSLLLNLGGGVVTDAGGFAASCFRRGISFVHIPTTLLAMVDAAIGGKNGVDLNNLKNQIGVIKLAEKIVIDKNFLKTLPEIEVRSGYAEILKHGMIDIKKSGYFYKCLSSNNFKIENIVELIEDSVKIKLNTVAEDLNESGLRKILNFGHTLGHAIESYRMTFEQKYQLLHGEAIAIGLVLETYISHKLHSFAMKDLVLLKTFVNKNYQSQKFTNEDQKNIIDLMKYDKKNEGKKVNFVLLEDIGEPLLDCEVKENFIYEAFEYYQS